MESNVVEVSGCTKCPMMIYNSDWEMHFCKHPYYAGSSVIQLSDLFATCPLKQKPILITLKENENGKHK